MRRRAAVLFAVLLALLSLSASAQSGARILFDASHREMAGNADWVVDSDLFNQNMPAYPCTGTTNESNPGRYPTPDPSGIGPTTPQTYWTGGVSAWGVELVKAGHTVEQLPAGAALTYGDGGNPQDLSNYDLFIAVEPNAPFTTSERAALLAFVNAGGGLFMVADHETSDRDCDGLDSPNIWNAVTGATSATSAGVFGIWFRVDGLSVKGEDWFDDGVDNNVTTDPADPIIHGPFGDGSGGLGFFGATSMDINPADNPAVTAHVWRMGQAHNTLRVTFATASYGAGRVAAIGDSSPADDNSGDPGDTLYPGWDLATGGVANREIHLNACHWLLNPAPDTTAPAITAGPAAAPADCTAGVTWTTDEAATSVVEYGLTAAYGSTQTVAGYTQSHSVVLSGLASGTAYHYRVRSTDASGNGPTDSPDQTFTTSAPTAPAITSGPSATAISGAGATLTWTTDEAATSVVEYGLTAAYGSTQSAAGYATSHAVAITGLTPETPYHYRVRSADACGNGPTDSPDATFTSGPASLDISGWQLRQFNTTLTYTFPAGTTLPSGGYLVVARDATRAAFEAFFPAMPPGTVFLNSNAAGSCSNGCLPQVNGAEQFELWNGVTMVDGRTIAMAENNAYQRTNPGDDPAQAVSWTTVAEASANPGAGAGTPSGAGVRINEMADASNYVMEFVELYYDATAAPADATAPAAVADLSALALSESQVRLSWTAPGDDGTTGTATAYDLRRSASPITNDTEFAAATAVAGLLAPKGAGSAELLVVTGLAADTAHYFALKTRDEVPNWSPLSNGASATTPAAPVDTTPPSAVTDLKATPQLGGSVVLQWTAPGDDGMTGTAAAYDVRRSASRILTSAHWDAATAVTSPPAPAAGGTAQQMTVPGPSSDTTYYFALKTRDEVPNVSALSNSAGATTAPAGAGGSADHLVISQFQTAGTGNDVVELYNPTASAISLTNHTLRNLSSAGNQGFQVSLSGSVPAYGWYLIAGSGYTGPPSADASSGTNNFSNTAGHIILVSKTGALTPSGCTDASVVDKVGYGTGVSCPEGGAGHQTPVPPPGQSCTRRPGGGAGNGTDTNDNAADFLPAAATTPRNSASPPATPPSPLGNVGTSLFLTPGSPSQLDWARAAGASAYRLFRGTSPDFMTGAPAPFQTLTEPRFTDADVPPALPQLYFYVVLATDGTNQSSN